MNTNSIASFTSIFIIFQGLATTIWALAMLDGGAGDVGPEAAPFVRNFLPEARARLLEFGPQDISTSLSLYLSIFLSLYLSIYLYLCISVSLYLCISASLYYLSIYLRTWPSRPGASPSSAFATRRCSRPSRRGPLASSRSSSRRVFRAT